VEELAREASDGRASRPPFELAPPVVVTKPQGKTVIPAQGNAGAEVHSEPLNLPLRGDSAVEGQDHAVAKAAPGSATCTDPALPAAIGPAGPGTESEKAEPLLSHPERIYVYELDAEERAPLGLESEVSIDDLVLNQLPQPAAASSGRRPLEDEPLIFEVTDARPKLSEAAGAAPPVGRSSSPDDERDGPEHSPRE